MQGQLNMRRAACFRQTRPRAVSRARAVQVRADNCLIVNTKGGGHAFIGLYLAKELVKRGHQVTIMNDGDKNKLLSKPPFNQYPELERSHRVKICWGNPTDPSTYPDGDFNVVYDNNGKDLESCKPLIDEFADAVDHYVFVSSAGAYKASDIEPCHFEGDPRKSSAGHVQVEQYLEAEDIPYTVFHPLYIYGPHTGKDCEQWFMDRIARDRPVCIPAPGVQLTSLSHVEDLASMMAAVPGNEDAIGQHYNACSDRAITFVGIAKAIAKAMGKEAQIVLYNPEELGLGKGSKAEGFPFRTVHFFANPDSAKWDLDWEPKHNFLKDVKDRVDEYYRLGRDRKEVDFSIDDEILAEVDWLVPSLDLVMAKY